MLDIQDTLKEVGGLQDKIEKEENHWKLFKMHKDLMDISIQLAMGIQSLNPVNAEALDTEKKIQNVAFAVENCMHILKRQYLKSIEHLIYLTREKDYEAYSKSTINKTLKNNPSKKQRLQDENLTYMSSWVKMWTLYEAIKIDHGERASPVDREMMEKMNSNVSKYLKNYKA